MGLFKKQTKAKKTPSFDNIIEKKLSLYITIVSQGHADAILEIMKKCGSSAQFVELGEGTAQKELRDILGIENNSKEIVLSFMRQDDIPEAKRILEIYFAANKRNSGIAFSIPLTSVIGVKVYQFLANTIKEN